MTPNQQPTVQFITPMAGPPARHDEAPARVRSAIELIVCLAAKTATRAAVNDMSIELIPGQVLSSYEQNAQAAACNMLADYFAGNMRPSCFERRRKIKAAAYPDESGIVLHCPGCMPHHDMPNCRICRGTGSILTFPVDQQEGE